MKNFFLSLFFLLFSVTSYSTTISKHINTIPESIQYIGQPVDIEEVTDVSGKHIVILSKVEEKTLGERGYKSEIYASKYTYVNGAYIEQWEVKEFNPSILAAVNFLGKIEAVDIDKDGIAETIFMYEVVPDGLDPITVKLMLHYKDKKYAIRGEIPQQGSDKSRIKIDSSFDLLPASVKSYAIQCWNRAMKKIAEQN